MTDDQDTTGPEQPTTDATEEPTTDATAPDPGEGAGEGGEPASDARPHREAARYRTQLREAEAQRDEVAGRLATMQRAEAERQAQGGSLLQNGADLWVFGAEVPEVLDDQGQVDPAKVQERAETILSERPYLRNKRFQGTADGGNRGTAAAPKADLADLFKT